MRLPNEEYKKATKCLKRYNYNCIKIIDIRADIMNLSGVNIDGLPKSKYSISDNVLDSVIKLQEDEDLQEAIKEYKAVRQAIEIIHKDSVYIFEELYRKGTSKWDIINALNVSEETYKRRKRELIYAVYEEIIKN